MAINFYQAKIIKRSKNQSALAESAYITRGVHADELSGRIYDYRYRGQALWSEIIIPAGSPLWLIEVSRSNEKLWGLIERIEKRRDAQLAREYVVALPWELPQDQLKILTQEYISDNFVSKGMVASYAIHPPNREHPTVMHII